MALSDDVENAVGTTVSKTGQVLGGTIRGGLLGAAVTFVGGALGLGIASGIGGGVAAGVAGTVTGAAFMLFAAPQLIVAGAAIGALLLGVGSLLPSVSSLFKGAQKQMHRHHDDGQTVVVEHHHHYEAPQTKRVIVCDNPDYQPGRGAAMAEKGDCAQSANVCR